MFIILGKFEFLKCCGSRAVMTEWSCARSGTLGVWQGMVQNNESTNDRYRKVEFPH